MSEADREFLAHAIDLARHALEDEGETPFGVIVVIGGETVSEGTSSVVKLADPTAHAEVMTLRSAGKSLGRHVFWDGIMYASSEPCPMCLVTCYWARLPRVVFGATSHDVAMNGFEDLQLYREMTYPEERRSLREDAASEALGLQVTEVLRSWSAALPEPVVTEL
ncbi:deaminase [Streptomyces sp. NPDC008317]|uniref:nucleoside deaminase n=1 Tax=Streptomyces sp. NPDC008317 TaxID=3364827 RepID=UPI0036ECD888